MLLLYAIGMYHRHGIAGSINADDLSITLTDSEKVVDDPYHSHYFAVAGISPTQAVLVYYNANASDASFEYYGYGPLTTVLATLNDDAIELSEELTLENSAATFSLAITAIDSDTVVVAYADPNVNYGILTQLVQLQTNGDGDSVLG